MRRSSTLTYTGNANVIISPPRTTVSNSVIGNGDTGVATGSKFSVVTAILVTAVVESNYLTTCDTVVRNGYDVVSGYNVVIELCAERVTIGDHVIGYADPGYAGPRAPRAYTGVASAHIVVTGSVAIRNYVIGEAESGIPVASDVKPDVRVPVTRGRIVNAVIVYTDGRIPSGTN